MTKQDEKKAELFEAMVEAVANYKEEHSTKNPASDLYASAQEATEAYAEYSGISYERAAQLALEIVNC